MEVDLVRADLLGLSWKKSHPESGVIARQQSNAILRVVGYLPPQKASPEAGETERVVRIDRQREEVTRHSALHRRSAQTAAGNVSTAAKNATLNASGPPRQTLSAGRLAICHVG
jgi:hypothetical protein